MAGPNKFMEELTRIHASMLDLTRVPLKCLHQLGISIRMSMLMS